MKYLTKTLFKKGLECPIKLTVDYESSEDKNEFLDALADGGFQAEELSRPVSYTHLTLPTKA